MSRSRKEVSNELFGRLIAAAPGLDLGTAARWITRLSEEDADLLAKAKTDGLKLGRKLAVACRKYDGRQFVSLIGFDNVSLDIDGLQRIDPSPAHFQLTVLAVDLNPTGSEAEIRDALEGRDKSDSTYAGHDLSEIDALFPSIDYFEILPDAPIAALDMDRLLGLAICKSNFEAPLNLAKELREVFTDIFETAPPNYPAFLALQGLVSAFWQTQYLELYRTIEQLFPAHAVSTLAAKIAYSDTPHSLFSELNRALGWRPQEEGALERLVSDVPTDIIEIMRQVFGVPSEKENWKTLVSRQIYAVRNSNVHFRGAVDGFYLSELDWTKLNTAMGRMSLHLYSAIGSPYLSMRSAAA
jgi:hypothetical protein